MNFGGAIIHILAIPVIFALVVAVGLMIAGIVQIIYWCFTGKFIEDNNE